MLQKPLKGGQSKEDEMDCGESEEEAAFGEIDNVCHQVEIFNAGTETDCLRDSC